MCFDFVYNVSNIFHFKKKERDGIKKNYFSSCKVNFIDLRVK